jgi:adenosine deaminase
MSPFRSHSRRDFLKAGVALTSTAIGPARYGNFVLEPITDEQAIDQALVKRLEQMPKTEIHVHLEGAMTPETVWHLAERNRVRLPADSLEDWRHHYAFRDFAHFIDVYVLASRTIAKAEDFTYVVEQFAAGQAAQRVLYSEVFLSASLHLGRFADEAIIEALEEGVANAAKKENVRLRFIPDIARERPDSQRRVLKFAIKGRDRGVFIGLSLAGREAEYPPELFQDTFAEAKRNGLHVVAHAGEVAGPKSVWGALNALHAERIGHGIRCLEDAELVAHLKILQTPLEVCPVSNYRTRAIATGTPHPIRGMVNQGLRCTVNSDDPPMFGTSLTNEYVTLATQGFTWSELWALNRATLEATFLSESERKELASYWNAFEKHNYVV